MSHEIVEPGRSVVYHLPNLYSDSLRTLQFSQFFEAYRGAPFAVRTADGWSWFSSTVRAPECTARFRNRADLDLVVGDASEATLARIFLNGGLEIQGNIFALLSVAEYALVHSEGLSSGLVQTLFRVSADLSRRLQRGRGATPHRNWHCAPCPLDLPVEFYSRWLGPTLGHGCGAFSGEDADLETAHADALERACDWLELSAGDDLLDVGCGWGSLTVYAGKRYTDVTAIPYSQAQADAATERIRSAGLESRCRVEFRDLRRASYMAGSFDKIASLGLFEQVPSAEFAKYLGGMKKLLVPGGLLLLHRLTPTRSSATHLRTLHPGLPTEPLSKDLALAEAGGWELVNVETLEKDYEETLRIWIGRLRQSAAELSRPFAPAYRAWLLYLVEMATSLHAEELQVHRLLLRRPSRARAVVCSRARE